MARSIVYWYDYMVAEKQKNTLLNVYQPNIDDGQTLLRDLRSGSKVARWRLKLWVVAACAAAFDVVLDLAIIVLQGIAANSRYGTIPWYVATARAFQYGDALIQKNLEFVYAAIDETKQIIALANANEGGGQVNLKVAKLTGDTPEKLDALELTAFTAYMQKRKPAGINVNIISDDPDLLKIDIDIKYDPLVLKDTGEMITESGTFPVEDTVNNYIKSLPFDGRFEIQALVDKLQLTTGVVTAYVTAASGKYGANPYTSFPQNYDPNAGYMEIDPTFPLSGTVTYTANV